MMNFDLWTFFVDNLFGSFWMAVFGIGVLIFLIMSVFGRMSKLSAVNYLLIYFMAMTVGYGYRWLTALLGFAIIIWFYFSVKNAGS